MRAVASRGRWIWGLSGLAVAASLAIGCAVLITSAGIPRPGPPQDILVRAITVPLPVTSLNVQSYGAPVQVTAGPVHAVQVTETILYHRSDGEPPAVTQSLSGGLLMLAEPACGFTDCMISFSVIVPPDVAVTAVTEGGPVTVSGVAGADLDSGGGPVRATGIHGPLMVSAEGGPVAVNDLTGPLDADTGGGPLLAQNIDAASATVITGGGSLLAQNIDAASATVSTEGGEAQIDFTAALDAAFVSTDGGPAAVIVPTGSYSLTTSTDGGPLRLGIATDPAARSTITVSTEGGPLQIEPAQVTAPSR